MYPYKNEADALNDVLRLSRGMTYKAAVAGLNLGGGKAVLHLAGGRFKERLLAYGGPILVINGSLDLVFRIGAGRFLSGVPRVSHHTIPRAGHLSNVDKPQVFTRLIEEFIGSLAP